MNDIAYKLLVSLAYTAGIAHRAANGGRPIPLGKQPIGNDGIVKPDVWECEIYAREFDLGWLHENARQTVGLGTPCDVASREHNRAARLFREKLGVEE